MLKIDDNLLQTIGLGALPTEDKRGLLTHIYETLEMRVGMRLADQMTNEQLDEFETYFEAKDDAGAFKWLETNFPNYKDIVNEEFEKLKNEVQQSAPQILAAAQANADAAPAAVAPVAEQTPGYPPAPAAMPQPVGAAVAAPAYADASQAAAWPAAPQQPAAPVQEPYAAYTAPTQPAAPQPVPSIPAAQEPQPSQPQPTVAPAPMPAWQPDPSVTLTPAVQPWQPDAPVPSAQPDPVIEPPSPTEPPAAQPQPPQSPQFQPMPPTWSPDQSQQ